MLTWLLLTAQAAVSSTAHVVLPQALASAVAGYDVAQVKGDRTALERYLAPDYLLVNGGAELENKAQLIGDFTDPAFKLEPYQVANAVTRYWSNGAVFAGEVFLNGTSAGKPFHGHTRFVDVWRLRNGKWQVVFTQVTRFPPKPN